MCRFLLRKLRGAPKARLPSSSFQLGIRGRDELELASATDQVKLSRAAVIQFPVEGFKLDTNLAGLVEN